MTGPQAPEFSVWSALQRVNWLKSVELDDIDSEFIVHSFRHICLQCWNACSVPGPARVWEKRRMVCEFQEGPLALRGMRQS